MRAARAGREPARREEWVSWAETYRGRRELVLDALLDLQARDGHLDEAALRELGRATGRNLSFLRGVASFYPALRFRAPGRHRVQVCRGLGCGMADDFVRREVAGFLRVRPGQVSRDGLFTWEEVSCLGVCAHAPVMVLDGQIIGKLRPGQARRILEETRQRERGR